MSSAATWLTPPIFTAVAGATGWYITVRLTRAAARSKHTFDVLLATAFNVAYQEHLTTVRPHIVKAGLDGFPDLGQSENRKLQTSVLFLLNYYEFLAGAVRHRVLAENLLRDDQAYIFGQLYTHSKKFIEHLRTVQERPALFEQIEWLYKRWNKNKIGRLQKLWEWVLTGPVYGKK